MVLGATPALADHEEAGKHYTGAHIGGAVTMGPSVLSNTGFDGGRLGYTLGVYGRLATTLSVVDLQLGYQFADHRVLLEDPGNGETARIHHHALSVSMNLHPVFLRILGNNRWWYFIAGLYIQSGMSVEFVGIRRASGDASLDTAFGLHIGAGFDVPLDDPDDGGGFWIGLNWRWSFVFMKAALEARDSIDTHAVLLAVSYRSNNLSFTRAPRPPELEFH